MGVLGSLRDPVKPDLKEPGAVAGEAPCPQRAALLPSSLFSGTPSEKRQLSCLVL